MAIDISGSDPFLHGPKRDYPAGKPLWLKARLKSNRAGMAQVFWFTDARPASEANSVRFPVPAGDWQTVRLPLPPLGPGTRLRFDPPGDSGTVILSSLEIADRVVLTAPAWPKPAMPNLTKKPLVARSGAITLLHAPGQWGGFIVKVDGEAFATGNTRPRIGTIRNGKAHWLDVAQAAKVTVFPARGGVTARAAARDADGAIWTLEQRFTPGETGTIHVESRASCDRARDVIYLPMLLLHPGMGGFGASKNQAVFAGLEYLDRDEPSSSEKDLTGPQARRQTPDTAKITFPLMAIQANDRYIGLAWAKHTKFAALFDSPDRIYRSGGHVMGILFPGSNGSDREEGNLLPYEPARLAAGHTLILRASILGGRGTSVAPAVQHYVRLRGLPEVPDTGLNRAGFIRLAAAGWLDSSLRAGGRYRHAYPGFDPRISGDAPFWMDYLAAQSDGATANRLENAADEALALVAPPQTNAAIGHVVTPAPALAFGRARETMDTVLAEARDTLKRFEPNGLALYRPAPGKPDFARTHDARHANGYAATLVVRVLDAAAWTGDPDLRREGLRLLRALDRYRDTVPRGAQIWEMPLHTPDILASGYLVRAYVRGYEMTGDPALLNHARYWAWTGVPFVYLSRPVAAPVGEYATIAVLGASNWVAPNWIGLPVQWCGLVYADALNALAPHDSGGPWSQIANGIAASGVQQTFPVGSDPARQGLLPDSFNLRAQIRNDPGINPATLLPAATSLFGLPRPYTARPLRGGGWLHVSGSVSDLTDDGRRVTFTAHPFTGREVDILIAGLSRGAVPPEVLVNGDRGMARVTYDAERGAFVIPAKGRTRVELIRSPDR